MRGRDSNGCFGPLFCYSNGCVDANEGLVKLPIDGAWQKDDP